MDSLETTPAPGTKTPGGEQHTTNTASALQHETPSGASTTADAIDELLALGLPVLAVEPGDKRPHRRLAPNGYKSASTDSATVRGWLADDPSMNLGVATGNGVVVLDLDSPEAHAWWTGQCAAYDLDEHLVPASTTGRGSHLWFALPGSETVPCTAGRLAPGVDIRGAGGYVVAPPSIHPNGTKYRWLRPIAGELPPIPDWLLHLIHEAAAKPVVESPPPASIESNGNGCVGPNYAAHIVQEAIDACRSGVGRHDALKTAAVKLRDARLEEAAIRETLESIRQAVSGMKDHAVSEKEVGDIVEWLATTTPRNPPPPGKNYKPTTAVVQADEGDGWGEARPFDDDQHGAPIALDGIRAVAPRLGGMIEQSAEAAQVPGDIALVLALASVGAACAKRLRVDCGGWSEPSNIYALALAPPGSRKSAIFAELVGEPWVALEAALLDATKPKRTAALSELRLAKKTVEKLSAKYAAATKPEDRDSLRRQVREEEQRIERLESDAREPRLLAGDATQEQATTLLADGEGALLLADPESAVLGIVGGRYSANYNAALLLKGHAGDDLIVDRRGRREKVRGPALSLALALQPGVWADFLEANPAARTGGLSARFAFAYPPSNIGSRSTTPKPLDPRVGSEYRALLAELVALPMQEAVVRMDEDAADAFRRFRERNEQQLGPGGSLAGIADWGSKQVGLAARVALIVHAARHGAAAPQHRIGLATLAVALDIADGLASHAMAALGVADPVERLAKRILDRLKKTGGPMTARDIYKALGTTAESAKSALALLEARHIVRVREEATGAHPKTVVEPNPAVLLA